MTSPWTLSLIFLVSYSAFAFPFNSAHTNNVQTPPYNLFQRCLHDRTQTSHLEKGVENERNVRICSDIVTQFLRHMKKAISQAPHERIDPGLRDELFTPESYVTSWGKAEMKRSRPSLMKREYQSGVGRGTSSREMSGDKHRVINVPASNRVINVPASNRVSLLTRIAPRVLPQLEEMAMDEGDEDEERKSEAEGEDKEEEEDDDDDELEEEFQEEEEEEDDKNEHREEVSLKWRRPKFGGISKRASKGFHSIPEIAFTKMRLSEPFSKGDVASAYKQIFGNPEMATFRKSFPQEANVTKRKTLALVNSDGKKRNYGSWLTKVVGKRRRQTLSVNTALVTLTDMVLADNYRRMMKNRENMRYHMTRQG